LVFLSPLAAFQSRAAAAFRGLFGSGIFILLSDANGTLIDHWRSLLRFGRGREKIARHSKAATPVGLGFPPSVFLFILCC